MCTPGVGKTTCQDCSDVAGRPVDLSVSECTKAKCAVKAKRNMGQFFFQSLPLSLAPSDHVSDDDDSDDDGDAGDDDYYGDFDGGDGDDAACDDDDDVDVDAGDDA